jgi:hypothetical protein
MRLPVVIALSAACSALVSLVAQAHQPAAGQGPQCTTSRLVGTWERVSLLRNALSVQPPDAPLFVKFSSDGHWSMMEIPDGRPTVDKPLEQQTEKELFTRFDKVEGGYGTWTLKGDILTRKHVVNIAPGGEGNNQDRLCSFEGEILALIGTGANRSPQARFKRLPVQQKPHNLVGSWERISATVDGKSTQPPAAPIIMILGEDGWFSQTQLPTGRKPAGKPLEKFMVDDYLRSFRGVNAARGTYTVEGTVLTRNHVADIDPNLVGYDEVREFSLEGDKLILRGRTRSGGNIEATFRRLKPRETSTP